MLEKWIAHGLQELPTTNPEDPATETSRSSIDTIPVKLLTSKHQEAFSFLRANFDGRTQDGKRVINRDTHSDLDPNDENTYPFYRPEIPKMYDQLPYLRPSALYVLGGKSALSTPKRRKPRTERTGTGVGGSGGAAEGRVKEVVFEEMGHLLAFEIVKDVADVIGDWTAEELKRWARLDKEWRDQWQAKSKEEKTMVTEAWKKNIGGDPRGPGSQKL